MALKVYVVLLNEKRKGVYNVLHNLIQTCCICLLASEATDRELI